MQQSDNGPPRDEEAGSEPGGWVGRGLEGLGGDRGSPARPEVEATGGLAGPSVETPWQTSPPPRRRWPLVVLLMLLAAGTAGGGVAAYMNYEAGSSWQERARLQEARAQAAETRADELAAELERTERLLDLSEQDVAMLEERLADLASEKAGAEDSAALAAETAEDLAAVIVFAAEVGGSLRNCIARNVELTNDIIAMHNADEFDPTAVNSRIDEVNAVCAEAENEYAQLRNRLDAIGD